ncbi:hypothetical protein EMIHUDRAFT_216646 [Emiliania huxleyi CCMP1516]|uniref:Nuclear speckle splicing regulatory protein 1 N-terminal domain-containing protein n=2 Tax=Emiliania huxleyi TaxID=2903 RepID=A0A0D3IDD0_EMIH1|nr:hypothetical protein EMIHUDRAFT_216646 [Emiliania huxleyi CCMP1516]EOD09265.1 hypothetical protein EMIHUDRAFT_216646 [Emiliania huxleyi CCMP1516]|eukprot:XP_005761694.1 hypothetical protein EMIHUDRAFT_216646 [Emiliania huxleyi CCMP1516]
MAPRAARGARSLKAAAKASRGAASKFEAAPVERKRHDVVGQRKPRAPKSSSAARKRSEAERRETLAVEYRNQHRSNVLIDGRFGEADDNLPAEEKHYARLQRERLRQARSSKFALEEPSAAALDAAIAKHKLARLDRKEERERERQLDVQSLLLGGAAGKAAAKPSGAGKAGGAGGEGAASYSDYHTLLAAMGGEVKAQPSDRLRGLDA